MNKKFKTFSKADEDDDEIFAQGTLPIAVDTRVQHTFTIPLDEPIGPPSYYRDVVKTIQDASEGDIVRIVINSPGGRMDGCSSILHALAATDATTVAELVGDAYSAASLIALSCDIVQVGENANMLCHSARWGFSGKSMDAVEHALHNKKITDQAMYRIYKHFLSEQEINEVIAGKELWLDADEICERLAQREELSQQEDAEEFTETNSQFDAHDSCIATDDGLVHEEYCTAEEIKEYYDSLKPPVPAKKTSKRKKS